MLEYVLPCNVLFICALIACYRRLPPNYLVHYWPFNVHFTCQIKKIKGVGLCNYMGWVVKKTRMQSL